MQAHPTVRCGQHCGMKLFKLVGKTLRLPPERHHGDQPQVGQLFFQRQHRQPRPQVEARSHAAEESIVPLIVQQQYCACRAPDNAFADGRVIGIRFRQFDFLLSVA